MTDDFAAPPSPVGGPGGPAGTASSPQPVRRADFRPPAPRRRRGRFPRWLLVLLAAGGAAVLIGVVAQVALTVRSSSLTPADPDATGRLGSAQVVAGMCLLEIGTSAGAVVAVDCNDAHSAEVVSSYTFQGDDWPGDDAVANTVLDYCTGQLAPGGPLAAAAEGREWVAWVPSEATWNAGDRTGLCIVTSDQAWVGRATD